MNRILATVAACLMLGGPAQAGSLAGARDGDYRADDGSLVLVASRFGRVSLDGLDCLHPTVRAGRIASTECWGNGHLGADLDAAWQVDGDVIRFRGRRYVLMSASSVKPDLSDAARVDPTGRPWRHNGSVVMADAGTGVIAYLEPRAALRPLVAPGTVLFRGRLHPDGPVEGTAYAYKAGCAPAPYPVRGAYSGPSVLTLRGAGPERRGCAVVGYSDRSPHAVLRFTYLLDD